MALSLRLRDVVAGDLELFFEHQRDPVAWQMAAFAAQDPRDRAAFDRHWEKLLADAGVVKRTIEVEGRAVGYIVCFEREGEREVGYWVGRAAWGRGIATAALAEFLRIAITRPLRARSAKDNVGSVRVLTKCGFALEREERSHSHARGGTIDEVVMLLDAAQPAPRGA